MEKLVYIILFCFTALFVKASVNFVDVNDVATWEKMHTLARAQNKNILVFAVPEYCADCKSLKKNTFKDKTVSQLVSDNFLALRVYDYTEAGQALNQLYQLPSEAGILLLNNRETLFLEVFGAITPTEFVEELNQAITKIASYPTLQKGAALGDLPKMDWVDFMLIEALNMRVTPSSPIVRDVSTLLDSSDFNAPNVQEYITTLGTDVDGPVFQSLKSHPNWIDSTTNFSWSYYFQQVFDFNIARSIDAKDSILLEDVLFQMQQLPEESQLNNLALKGRQLYLAAWEKWPSYDTITMAYLSTLPTDSANAFQREAIFLMQYHAEDKPLRLAGKYLDLGLKKQKTYDLYYTLGLYLFNQGDLLNAYTATYNAYQLATTNDEKRLAAQFLELIDTYY